MEIILVRHGEPDYSEIDAKDNLEFDHLAPLTTKGMEQAHCVSKDDLFENAEIVISSPYTRAFHTAAIISNNLNLNLIVDVGFHERLPDTKNELKTKQELQSSFKEYDLYKGIHTDNESHYWESIDQQINRVKYSLNKYMNYSKIIIVTHGELIRRFKAVRLPFCGLVQVEYNEYFEFLEWS
jgi:broad specificity phosphatase PhoE